jgi:peptidoglycan/LPS O-acetylase OafA/YrhL
LRSDNIAYLPAVDQLRGIAALWIVIYHAFHLVSYRLAFGGAFAPDHWPAVADPLSALIVEGHAAVGLFMVLSGFILTYGAWGRQIDYFGFLRNRLLRIYPLALFLLVVAIYSMPERFSWGAFWQTLLLGHNLPGAFAGAPYTDMFWAISVEFQFYLVFPLLCVILRQRTWRTFAIMVLLLMAFRAIATTLGANIRDVSYLTIVGRLDQFLIGMVLGAWWRDRPTAEGRLMWLPLTIFVWSVALWGFNRMGGWPALAAWKMLWPTAEGILSALFIYAYLCAAPRLPRMFSGALQRIGQLSYSLYLVHMVIISLILDHLLAGVVITFPLPVIVLALVLPGTLLLATLTYFGIEKPFLGLRGRYLS